MNPYEILGLPQGASPEDVNRVYKEKMAQYNANGVESDEMNQLNQAYDAIMYNGQSTYNSTAGESIKYGDVRAKIREKRYEDAETILVGVPIASRDAEWYFLKGNILHARGWLEEAGDCYAKAVQLEPNNLEYAAAHKNVKQKESGAFRNNWESNQDKNTKSGCVDKLCCSCACCDECCCDCC